MSDEIRNFSNALGIQYLLHFTRADNLALIMQHGIVPVALTADKGIEAFTNDCSRFDYQPEATCISIGFPNHRMFYKFRNADETSEWAVLAIKPAVLWTKPCAFCQRNAADALVTAIPIEERMTAAAFSAMYQEVEGERSRKEQKLKAFDPTHDQAEVLVFDVIEPNLIVGAAFNSKVVKEKYQHLLGDRQVVLQSKNGGLFGSRSYSREYLSGFLARREAR
jgi:hypothetical protein